MNCRKSEDDEEFKRQFESCEIPASEFNHEAHLRLAYVFLADNNAESSYELMRNSLRKFLKHNGVDPAKYHETLTKAWILAVHHFMNQSNDCYSAKELITQYPEMLDSRIMMTHYSTEVLFSDEARKAFIHPDLDPIPRHGK